MLRRIVVGYDFSEGADDALAWAADLARSVGARVEAMHVIDAPAIDAPEVDDARRKLAEAVQDLGVEVSTHVEVGSRIAEQLIAHADETDADALVVAMTESPSVRRWFLGSVADEVLRKARCPVIAYRSEDT